MWSAIIYMDCCFGITGVLQGICDERLWEWVLGQCIGVSFGDVVSLGVLDFRRKIRRNSASLTRRYELEQHLSGF